MAAGPGTQTRRITISVDTKGSQELKNLSEQLGGINQATKSLASTLNTLTGVAATFLGGLGVHQLIEFSDQVQEIHDRLVALTGSQFEATRLLKDLGEVARDTDQSLQGTSDTFLKLGNSLKDAKLSSASLLEITKTLLNTFRLSGSSAEEARGSVNNLAASFQLGGLKARDLRNILKENQVLAQALRKEFGNNLLSAANNGFISVAKVAEVLYKNMGDINKRADQMGATFSESTTKGLDAFKIKVFEINDALGLSGGFAKIMDGVIKNMGTFITLGTIIAVSTLPSITIKIGELAAALLALSPAALALTGTLAVGLTAVVAAFGNSWDIGDLVNQMKVGFSELQAIFDDLIAKVYELIVSFKKMIGDMPEGFDKMAKAARMAAQDARVHARALEIEYDATKALGEQQAKTAQAAARHAQDLAKLNGAFHPDLSPEQMLAALNAQFKAGTITIQEYNDALQEVDMDSANKKFRDGKINLEQLNEAWRKNDLHDFNIELKNGLITLDQYDDAVRSQKLDKLQEDLDAGRISLIQFNHELAGVSNNFSASGAFRTGLQDYISAIGTTTQQVAKLITNTFNRLEDQLVDFVKKGQFNFAQFTQAILDDLLRIIIRMSIIQPLAGGLLGAFTASPTPATGGGYGSAGGTTADFSGTAAHGAYFDGGVSKFAAGGVVASPTAFGFGNGKRGLMGEAGPEAIIPLKRGSGGDLGVKASLTPVTINIIDQNNSKVSQTETIGPNGDKQIEVLIQAKVREGIGSGAFDKSFKQSYGLSRKGT